MRDPCFKGASLAPFDILVAEHGTSRKDRFGYLLEKHQGARSKGDLAVAEASAKLVWRSMTN
jgi:hypothetical protein